MKKFVSTWSIIGLMFFMLMLGLGAGTLLSRDSIFDQLEKFKDVLALTQKFYIDTTNVQKLTESAINGLLSQLDPHSVYLPPQQTKLDAERFQGSYEGVGLEIVSINDTIMVSEPMGGGPAARLGILSNDRIVRIDDSSAIGLTTAQASQRLRGSKGTKVTVVIFRAGEKAPMVFEITRDNIALNSVDVAAMLPDNVGYVSVNKFSATTYEEIDAALKRLKDQGMERLILDLRNNPGGYLQQAEEIADLFIDGGTAEKPKTLVYTKARTPELEESYLAKSGDDFEKIPLIVLVNNGSASASEIVSGAIQDWDRGLIVGETSFGKGLVQHQWGLSDGSSLRLTIAKYYTPSGRLIQRPYDGKDRQQYRDEVYHREEKEGANLDHAHDVSSDTSRPKFYTCAGRLVYGGGGITPDYIVKPLDITDATRDFLRRDLFYPFITGYLDAEAVRIRFHYTSGYPKFVQEFEISDNTLKDFHGFVEKKGVKVTKDVFSKDELYIKARLKAYIARGIWGEEGWFSTMASVDTQLKKALTLFPEAQKMAGLEVNQKSKKMN